ncbi:MAG: hypothetical protein LBI54_05420, partial [Lachnospiraceae bacterium]|nr:hypothetical protein [Lachnospiraceae bacterium]
MAEARIDNDGFTFIEVFLKHRSKPTMYPQYFKVDSGANCTTISRRALSILGYDDDWIKAGKRLEGNERPTVATGEAIDNCYLVILPEIHIGGCVGYNWPVRVSLNEKVQFRLLFGTDSMRFFNFEFDYEQSVCRFRLIPGKRQLSFNQKEQSIHAV